MGLIMENIKKVFLITKKEKKPYHIQNLKARYKEKISFVDLLEDADLILCVGQFSNEFEMDIQKAQELGLRISYFTEELLPIKEIQKAFQIEYMRKQVKDEIAYSGEEL